MPRTCTVCSHVRHDEIDRRLLAGEAFRNIAKRVSLSPAALFRHSRHLPADLIQAHRANEIARGDDLVWELQGLASEARRLQAKAEADGDTRTAIAALRELTRLIELRARVAGELKDRQVNVLSVNLDESTAARMAELYLSRRKAAKGTIP
jgi:hypothetical protein